MSGRGALWRWSLATLLPWLAAGVAAACALGELTVTGADRPHRLGLPPPPWVFGFTVAAAVLAAVILRRTRAPSAPLLLGAVTLVPWLPIPMPAVALAFTGPCAGRCGRPPPYSWLRARYPARAGHPPRG